MYNEGPEVEDDAQNRPEINKNGSKRSRRSLLEQSLAKNANRSLKKSAVDRPRGPKGSHKGPKSKNLQVAHNFGGRRVCDGLAKAWGR